MDGNSRRKQILAELMQTDVPISAAAFAREHGVSRQVIVGDIALMRAEGSSIIATARGYMMQTLPTGKYIGTIACRHTPEETRDELSAIVDEGGTVIDVIVSHRHYGDLTGQLNISTQSDVDVFVKRIVGQREHLLSELTDGIHLHTISCADRTVFEAIEQKLSQLGFLLSSAD